MSPNPIYEALADVSMTAWKETKQSSVLGGSSPDLAAMTHVHRERGDVLVHVATVINSINGPDGPRECARHASLLMAPDVLVFTADSYIQSSSLAEARQVKPGDMNAAWDKGERERISEALIVHVIGRTDSAFRAWPYERNGFVIHWKDPIGHDSADMVGAVSDALRARWGPDGYEPREMVEEAARDVAPPGQLERQSDLIAAAMLTQLGFTVMFMEAS